jgi:hypothetical protein
MKVFQIPSYFSNISSNYLYNINGIKKETTPKVATLKRCVIKTAEFFY